MSQVEDLSQYVFGLPPQFVQVPVEEEPLAFADVPVFPNVMSIEAILNTEPETWDQMRRGGIAMYLPEQIFQNANGQRALQVIKQLPRDADPIVVKGSWKNLLCYLSFKGFNYEEFLGDCAEYGVVESEFGLPRRETRMPSDIDLIISRELMDQLAEEFGCTPVPSRSTKNLRLLRIQNDGGTIYEFWNYENIHPFAASMVTESTFITRGCIRWIEPGTGDLGGWDPQSFYTFQPMGHYGWITDEECDSLAQLPPLSWGAGLRVALALDKVWKNPGIISLEWELGVSIVLERLNFDLSEIDVNSLTKSEAESICYIFGKNVGRGTCLPHIGDENENRYLCMALSRSGLFPILRHACSMTNNSEMLTQVVYLERALG